MKGILLTVFLLLPASLVEATDLTAAQQALELIDEFTDDFCEIPPLIGTATGLELSGEAKAELNELISKMADVGIQGAAKYRKDQYQGLLQKDLVTVYRDSSNCRLAVWRDLQDKLVVIEPAAGPQTGSATGGFVLATDPERALLEQLRKAEEDKRMLEAELRLAEAGKHAEAALRVFNLRSKPPLDLSSQQMHTLALLFRENARAEEIDAYLELCKAGVGLVESEVPGSWARLRAFLDAGAQLAAGSNVGPAIVGTTREERVQSYADLILESTPFRGEQSLLEVRRQALKYPSLTFR